MGPERQRCHDHITAVTSTDDANFILVHIACGNEEIFSRHAIVKITFSVGLIIELLEGFPVTTTAAIVHCKNCISMVGEVLNERPIAYTGLTSGSTVDPD